MNSRVQASIRNSIIITTLIVVILSCNVSAQKWQGGVNFQLGYPKGTYKEQIDKTGVGISADFLYAHQNSIFGIGVALGWMQVGNEERKEPFSTTIPDVTVDVTTENNLAQFMLLFRMQPRKGPILPYADGLLGINYLYTKTSITNASNGEEVASTTNFDDNAFSYGFGGGLMISVYDRKQTSIDDPLHVFIDLNFRYIIGGEAEYLKEGSIRRNNGVVTYDTFQSETNIVTAHLGVVFNF